MVESGFAGFRVYILMLFFSMFPSCMHMFLLAFVPLCIGHFAWGVRSSHHSIGGGWFPILPVRRAKSARVSLIPAGDSGVSGQLILTQSHPNGPVLVKGLIKGLKKGPHGFHVHMNGELGNGCKDAGSHFNPFMASKIIFFFKHSSGSTFRCPFKKVLSNIFWHPPVKCK